MKQSEYIKPKKRGQLSSGEIIVAYFIFFLALTASITLWVDATNKINNRERLAEFQDAASDIAEKLVRTKGVPLNWTKEDVAAIGLAREARILSPEKILYFVELMNDSTTSSGCGAISEYECNKHLMGLGKYDFYFQLEDLEGEIINIGGVNCIAGRVPVNEAEKITIIRSAILEENITRIKFTLWYTSKEMA